MRTLAFLLLTSTACRSAEPPPQPTASGPVKIMNTADTPTKLVEPTAPAITLAPGRLEGRCLGERDGRAVCLLGAFSSESAKAAFALYRVGDASPFHQFTGTDEAVDASNATAATKALAGVAPFATAASPLVIDQPAQLPGELLFLTLSQKELEPSADNHPALLAQTVFATCNGTRKDLHAIGKDDPEGTSLDVTWRSLTSGTLVEVHQRLGREGEYAHAWFAYVVDKDCNVTAAKPPV